MASQKTTISGRVRNAMGAFQRLVDKLSSWRILFVVAGFLVILIGVSVELHDRQSERIDREWRIVLEAQQSARECQEGRVSECEKGRGSTLLVALEYLNRETDGVFCIPLIRRAIGMLTGDDRSECLIPAKRKENLEKLYLREASLSGINLPSAQMDEVNFRAAILRGADFSCANLKKARFDDAELSELIGVDVPGYTDIIDVSLCKQSKKSDLPVIKMHSRCASYNYASFQSANLRKARLDDAALRCVNFYDANLRYAILTEANLKYASLIDADLREADLEGAVLRDADFSGANLKDANLDLAKISGADFSKVKELTAMQLEKSCVGKEEEPPKLPRNGDFSQIEWQTCKNRRHDTK